MDRAAGRNLAITLGERLENFRFPIRDRGSNFTSSLDAVFQATGTVILRTAVQAPRMNATCERFIGTLRRELLDRVLITGDTHLRRLGRVPDALQHWQAAPGHRSAHPPAVNTTLPASPQETSAPSGSAEDLS